MQDEKKSYDAKQNKNIKLSIIKIHIVWVKKSDTN